jgi:hypothetical protein
MAPETDGRQPAVFVIRQTAQHGRNLDIPFQIPGVRVIHLTTKPFEDESCLNVIKEFSPYLKEKTTLHHYKDKLVNAV